MLSLADALGGATGNSNHAETPSPRSNDDSHGLPCCTLPHGMGWHGIVECTCRMGHFHHQVCFSFKANRTENTSVRGEIALAAEKCSKCSKCGVGVGVGVGVGSAKGIMQVRSYSEFTYRISESPNDRLFHSYAREPIYTV